MGKETMAWDFFWRLFNSRKKWDKWNIATARFNLPINTSLKEGLEIAKKNGMPVGSHQSGCFEVQTDKGIYSRKDKMKIDVSTPRRERKVIFKTWDQLEEEEGNTKPEDIKPLNSLFKIKLSNSVSMSSTPY
jgi:hypothetical protein